MFLLTRPNHDDRVAYLHYWAEEVLSFADKNNIKKKVLPDKEVTRRKVEDFLRSKKPKLILFNGHGDEKTIFGHHDEAVLDKSNAHLAAESIIYALACSSAKELGIEAIEKGVIAYIGFTSEFGWIVDPARSAVPSKDKRAEPFKIFANTISLELLRGKSTREACERAKMVGNKLIREYATSDSPEVNEAIRFWLFRDMELLKLHGSETVVFN